MTQEKTITFEEIAQHIHTDPDVLMLLATDLSQQSPSENRALLQSAVDILFSLYENQSAQIPGDILTLAVNSLVSPALIAQLDDLLAPFSEIDSSKAIVKAPATKNPSGSEDYSSINLMVQEMYRRDELLTAQEEVDLSKQILAGKEAKLILLGTQNLDPHERQQLEELKAAAHQALNRFTEQNQRLVVSIAKKICYAYTITG